jgi:hypothetical protein
MRAAHVGRLALQTHLALSRFGWSRFVAVQLCVAGALCWLWWIPQQRAEAKAELIAIEGQRMALRATRAAPHAATTLPTQAHLTAFYATLGDRQHAERQVGTLFAIARSTGLVLAKGEYTSVYDRVSQIDTYQILLPVAGPYSAIRRFCEQVLLTLPFASLDEISFKRDAIGNGVLDARLRFTLYLKDLPVVRLEPEKIAMEDIAP